MNLDLKIKQLLEIQINFFHDLYKNKCAQSPQSKN